MSKKTDNIANTTWSYIVKYRVILLLIIPIFLSVFLRMQPAYLQITDQWAEGNVRGYYENQISAQISKDYPNLPQANRDALISTEIQKIYSGQGPNIGDQVAELSTQFKNRFKDENGQTYLLAIDPYVFYKTTKNYVNYGQPGDTIVDGVSYDSLRDGRNLREQPPQFHSYVMYLMYKVMHVFNPNISVMTAVFYFPVILCTLAVIPGFFLARKIGGDFGGLFSAVLVAVHPSVIGRTAAGFSDTDSYNLFFPLLIAWVFIEAFDAKTVNKKMILGTLSGLLIGIYTLAWGGWWYVYDFLLATIVSYIVLILFRERKNLKGFLKGSWTKNPFKNTLVTSGVFIVSSNVFIILMNMSFMKYPFKYTLQFLPHFITQPLAFTTYKAVAVKDIWPNVLTTVAELNLASTNQVMNQIGGRVFFVIGILALVLIIFSKEKFTAKIVGYLTIATIWILIMLGVRESIPSGMIFLVLVLLPPIGAFFLVKSKESVVATKYGLFTLIWFAATFYAATRGMRFSALIVPGLALTLGAGIGIFYKLISEWLSKAIDLNKSIVKVVVMIMLLLLLVSPVRSGYKTSLSEIPSMNDAWYDSLKEINADSDDSIITSWWDFGHWFASIAERRVTFDGGSQGRRIHWVGKTLLDDDEEEAIGILRMLNCDQENAYNKALEYTGDQLTAVNLLYSTFKLKQEDAKKTIEEAGLSETETDDLLSSLYCEELNQYYIASEDMVGKSGVWAHFGSWDFTRGAMWNRVKGLDRNDGVKILIDDFGLDETKADQYYYEIQTTDADKWVSPWPSYASGVGRCSVQGTVATCATGLRVDISTGDATITTSSGSGKPVSLVYINEDGKFTEFKYENPKLPYSAAMFTKDGKLQSILMQPSLAKSMFTRLFFFEGADLNYFEPVSKHTQVTGGDIYVYRVNWDAKPAVVAEPNNNNADDDSDLKVNMTEEESEEIVEPIEDIETENLTKENGTQADEEAQPMGNNSGI